LFLLKRTLCVRIITQKAAQERRQFGKAGLTRQELAVRAARLAAERSGQG
jgi:hypothetical protein